MIITDLIKSLRSFGIRADKYKRPPNGEAFAMSIAPRHSEGVVMIHQGDANIEIFGDRKSKQAVVIIQEKAQATAPKFVEGVIAMDSMAQRPSKDQIEARLRNNFGSVTRGKLVWSFRNVKVGRDRIARLNWHVSAMVTRRASNRTNNFLIGMDETHHFIAPLPKKVTSVQQAHALLRPKGLSAAALRQGEWFFDPVKELAANALDKVVSVASRRIHRIELGQSTHAANSALVMKGTYSGTYARGYITDNRKGHHKPLFLRAWHKIVRNKEIGMPRNLDAKARRRRQSYD